MTRPQRTDVVRPAARSRRSPPRRCCYRAGEATSTSNSFSHAINQECNRPMVHCYLLEEGTTSCSRNLPAERCLSAFAVPERASNVMFTPASGTIRLSTAPFGISSIGSQPGLAENQRQVIVPHHDSWKQALGTDSNLPGSVIGTVVSPVCLPCCVHLGARSYDRRTEGSPSRCAPRTEEFVWRLERRKNSLGGSGSDLRVLLRCGSRRKSEGRRGAGPGGVGTVSRDDRRCPGASGRG